MTLVIDNVEFAGAVTLQTALVNGQVSNVIPATLVPTGTTQTVDWSLGQWQKLSLEGVTGTLTLSFINAIAGTVYTLQVTQHPTVPVALTLPVECVFPDSIHPVVSVGASAKDRLVFAYDGTTYETNIGQSYGR